MQHTSLLSTLRLFEAAFVASPGLRSACTDATQSHKIITTCCSKGGGGDDGGLHASLWQRPPGGSKANVALAFLIVLKHNSPDGIISLKEQLKDRAHRCESARKQAYTALLQAAAALLVRPLEASATPTPWDALLKSAPMLVPTCQVQSIGSTKALAEATSGGSTPLHLVASSRSSAAARSISMVADPAQRAAATEALVRVLECIEGALDAHKLAAFKSALHEPARLWYHLSHNAHHRDHVNVHGLNGYLCLVRGALGCQMPLLPMESDGDTFKGCGDCWSGLTEKAWAAFSHPDAFGKDMEAILRKGTSGFLRSSCGARGDSGANDGFASPNGGALEAQAKRGDKKLQPYVERFGFFFSSERLTQRLFETLNAEADPNLAGYRMACDALWPLFADDEMVKAELRHPKAGTEEEDAPPTRPQDLAEFVYDEYFIDLDVARAEKWFQWLGVFKM